MVYGKGEAAAEGHRARTLQTVLVTVLGLRLAGDFVRNENEALLFSLNEIKRWCLFSSH